MPGASQNFQNIIFAALLNSQALYLLSKKRQEKSAGNISFSLKTLQINSMRSPKKPPAQLGFFVLLED